MSAELQRITNADRIEPLEADFEFAKTLGTADVAALVHELRRMAWNGNDWLARYGQQTAVNALLNVGDMRPLPR
jgi:catalase (peroxidase I)